MIRNVMSGGTRGEEDGGTVTGPSQSERADTFNAAYEILSGKDTEARVVT